jgi:hypothetical protein
MSMKNYLTSALAVLLLVILTDTQAQVRSGRVIGLNLSTMTLRSKDISYHPETLVGINFGGIFEIPVFGNLALQPGIIFSAKGSVYKIDTLEYSIAPIFIEVPVSAAYSFGSHKLKVSLFAGSYFAYGIGGNKMEAGGQVRKINFGSELTDDMNHFDIGLNFGASLNINGLIISVQYGLGLSNLSPVSTVDSEMKNKVIGISFISLFPVKK